MSICVDTTLDPDVALLQCSRTTMIRVYSGRRNTWCTLCRRMVRRDCLDSALLHAVHSARAEKLLAKASGDTYLIYPCIQGLAALKMALRLERDSGVSAEDESMTTCAGIRCSSANSLTGSHPTQTWTAPSSRERTTRASNEAASEVASVCDRSSGALFMEKTHI